MTLAWSAYRENKNLSGDSLKSGWGENQEEGAIKEHTGSTTACSGKVQLVIPSEPIEPLLGSSVCINHVLLVQGLKLHSIFFLYHPTVNEVGQAYSKQIHDQFFLLKFPIF